MQPYVISKSLEHTGFPKVDITTSQARGMLQLLQSDDFFMVIHNNIHPITGPRNKTHKLYEITHTTLGDTARNKFHSANAIGAFGLGVTTYEVTGSLARPRDMYYEYPMDNVYGALSNITRLPADILISQGHDLVTRYKEDTPELYNLFDDIMFDRLSDLSLTRTALMGAAYAQHIQTIADTNGH